MPEIYNQNSRRYMRRRDPVFETDPEDRRKSILHADRGDDAELRNYVLARGGEKPKPSPFDNGRLGEPFNDDEEGELIRLTAELHRHALRVVDAHEEEIARFKQMIYLTEEIDKMACRILGRNIRVVEAEQ